MASQSRRKTPALIEQLFNEGHRFEFFQAVRLLESLSRVSASSDVRSGRHSVGQDRPPREEIVRFRVLPSLSFSAGSVNQIQRNSPAEGQDQAAPLAEMTVSFMGLTGPQGVLPQHYTAMVIERCHVSHKDTTLRDFFDLFNHRTISLFYRAWEKYRFPFAYERFRLDPAAGDEDLFTACLYCFVGLGTAGLKRRLDLHDDTVLYYGGHYAHSPKSAVALECLLADHFGLPAKIEQFSGRWLYLNEDAQSSLPSNVRPEGLNCEVGQSVIIGKRVWDVQGKFRIALGPLTYKQFLQFLPNGNALRALSQLVRLYAGPQFTFDVQALLKAAEVPFSRLGKADKPGTHLGWNAWLNSRGFSHDAKDAVFCLKEI